MTTQTKKPDTEDKLEEMYSKKNEQFAAADEFELVEETVDPPKGTNFRVTRVKRMKEEKRSKTLDVSTKKKQYIKAPIKKSTKVDGTWSRSAHAQTFRGKENSGTKSSGRRRL